MARQPVIGWRDVVRAFEKSGWVHDRTRGSHYVMIRSGRLGLLSIPMHNPIKRGTLRALIREAGMTVEEFVALLS
jgi:predicted RNA binding protein YcfA (HicA-like mRNA interferase family)